jgi:zinc transport system substrate-binding protein
MAVDGSREGPHGSRGRANRKALIALALLVAPALLGAAEPAVRVAVTTSMIEAAVRELTAGLPAALEIVRLLPPGSCPGHFDLSARDLARLADARLILRHDFQTALDERLARVAGGTLRVVAVTAGGTLLRPDRFLALAEQVRAHLDAALPALAATTAANAERLQRDTAGLSQEAHERAAAWQGYPVIASVQQREFCSWLGLKVVGELPREEDLSPRDLAVLQQAEAQAVIGNLQSDTRPAKALAQRLRLPVAILSNFPDSTGYGTGFADLFRRNLDELGRACRKPSPN